MPRPLSFVWVLAFLSAAATAEETLLWVEAEQPLKKQLVDNPGLNDVNPDELSAGAWICSFAHEKQPTGTAEYAVEAPKAGSYRFWARAVGGTGLAYRLDSAKDAVDVAIDKGKDPIPIAANGNPFYPPRAAWYDLGTVELAQGKHTITWYLGGLKGKVRWGGMDCFVLTTGGFAPNGKYKPGEKAPKPVPAFQPGQAWDFVPEPDKLDSSAVLDLRGLNEKVAGEHGFIRLSQDGNSFVRGDGQPIRFWAAGERTQANPSLDALKRQAQFLAKRGVNALRIFAMLPPKGPSSKITDIDEKELDCVFKVVAAMKSAGIYTIIDGYWAAATKIRKGWDVTSPGRDKPEGLLFFDPKFQAGYKAWMKALCNRPNPHTGVRLADEPAVAIIQLQNEDSLLWWGVTSIKGDALALLRRQFAEFLVRKHGSLEKARAAWQNYRSEFMADDWQNGLPGLLHVWDLTRDGWAKKGRFPGFLQRSADQLEFLARTMHRFNTDMAAYLRKELGVRQLLNANNWRTADLVALLDSEYWAYTANDVLARNIYTGGLHQGVNNGWQILPGHYYSDRCLIRDPVRLPTNIKQPQGHPFILPEVLWCPPNLYQSEAPLLVAAQKSLTGLAAACWFSNWVAEWDQNPSTKWTYSTPMQIGQFPAAALLYRKGFVKAGEPAIVEQRSLQNLWERKTPLISEEPGWDPNRDQGNIPLTSSIKTVLDPLAYLVGPVRVVYDGDPAKSTAVDLAKYIDRKRKIVRSITGEIETDYGRGIYRVNAPKAQAVAGFLGDAGPQRLADVEITCRNRYATIVVVPLDDRPIRESGKVLVQVGTLARPTGWTVRPARVRFEGKQADAWYILSTGKAPWQVERADATVTVANPRLTKATLLDMNGMPTPTRIELTANEGRVSVTLPTNTLYLVLTAAKQPWAPSQSRRRRRRNN